MVQELHTKTKLNFMAGGGKMGALIRAYDWNTTSLGNPKTWPQALKVSVRLMLTTGHPMLLWWGDELIQLYNDAYALTLGSERHPSALGQTGHACWAEIWPDIEPQITKVVAGKGYTWNQNQLLQITRNGKRENMYWTYSYGPIDDPSAKQGVGGVMVICSETTKQVQAEQEMKAAEARWRALFDQTPSFMCILQGPEHYFEYANKNYYEMVGHRELLGKSVREAIPEIAAQGFVNLLDEVYKSGNSHKGEAAQLTFGNREPIFIDFIYQPILEASGRVNGILVQGYDVTEREHANKFLKDEDRRKDEFLAMLAHELRNPLAPIRNVSEMLTQSAQQDQKLQNLGSILARQVTHMTHLMDDLLDISRISQNRISLQYDTHSVSNIVLMALESLQSAIALKNHHVNFSDATELLYVSGDLTRLVQCVTNVINNAVKYTPSGGEVNIAVALTNDQVEISVSDNGCGISSEMQNKVFELFTQATQTLDRSQGGLGIGLNIVHRLVQMHGGNVTVYSDGVGCGSLFCISLPQVEAPQKIEKNIVKQNILSKRVLVVDDNIDAADTMAELLTFKGHNVVATYTAQQALQAVDDFDPEIVLLDIGLPDMNGYEVAVKILDTKRKRILVAVTGYGQPEDVRKAKEVGFTFHFTKPVSLADLDVVFTTLA